MAKKESKKVEDKGPIKKAAPKTNKTAPKETKPVLNEEVVPMPVKKVTNTKVVEEKHNVKAEKKAAKKAKHDAKPLHFHFFRFVLSILIFALTTIIILVGAMILYNGQFKEITFLVNDTQSFILGIVIMIAFAIWMAEFQLAFRRFFRIGRYERIRKAEAKKAKKIEKYKIKHADKL